MNYKSINDEEFEEKISLKESYEVMYEFLLALHERAELETGVLLGFIGLLEDGGTADPAQLYDYIAAVEKVKGKST